MKTNITIGTLVAISVLGFSTASAQADSVSYRKNTTTTTTTTTTTSSSNAAPVQTVAVAPAPAPNDNATTDHTNDRPPLRHGEFGVRYMPTFGALRLRTYDNQTVDGSLSMSQGWGVMLGFNFNDHVGIQGEVNYNEINQKYKDRPLERTVHVSYLNIPVMLSLNTNKSAPVNLNFVVGPQFGFNVGSNIKGAENGSQDSVKAVIGAKAGDVGAAYGAGLEFMLNRIHTVRLDLGFRGYYGLVNMQAKQTSSSPDTYNVLLSATRKTYAGYIGITFLF